MSAGYYDCHLPDFHAYIAEHIAAIVLHTEDERAARFTIDDSIDDSSPQQLLINPHVRTEAVDALMQDEDVRKEAIRELMMDEDLRREAMDELAKEDDLRREVIEEMMEYDDVRKEAKEEIVARFYADNTMYRIYGAIRGREKAHILLSIDNAELRDNGSDLGCFDHRDAMFTIRKYKLHHAAFQVTFGCLEFSWSQTTGKRYQVWIGASPKSLLLVHRLYADADMSLSLPLSHQWRDTICIRVIVDS